MYSKPEFLESARKDFVLVSLDFPRSEEAKARVPKPARNRELQEQYGVQGFPTVLLMTVDGTVYGRTGYQPGGPSAYNEHLKDLRSQGHKLLEELRELLARYGKAEGPARLAAWDELANKLAGLADNPDMARKLEPSVREAFQFDADNKLGKKQRALASLLKGGVAEDADADLARTLDPKNEAGLLELAVAHQSHNVHDEASLKAAMGAIDSLFELKRLHDKELGAELLTNCAFWSQRQLNDTERAKAYGKRALELEPTDERVLEFLKELLKS